MTIYCTLLIIFSSRIRQFRILTDALVSFKDFISVKNVKKYGHLEFMFIRSDKMLLQKMRETFSLQLSQRNLLFIIVLFKDTYLGKGDPAQPPAQNAGRWRKIN
jgi:hypothetical protein